MKPPGVSGIKRACGGCGRAFLRPDEAICPGQHFTSSRWREINLARSDLVALATGPSADPRSGNSREPQFAQSVRAAAGPSLLALQLSIGVGLRFSRTNPRPGARKWSGPSLQAKGPDHLDRSKETMPGPGAQ